MEQNTSKKMVIIAAVVALALGMGGGYLIGKGMSSDDNMSMTTQSKSSPTVKSAQLGVTLDGLLREHVSTSLTVTRNIVDGVSDQKMKGSEAAQTANAVAIAKAVGSVYGEGAQKAI